MSPSDKTHPENGEIEYLPLERNYKPKMPPNYKKFNIHSAQGWHYSSWRPANKKTGHMQRYRNGTQEDDQIRLTMSNCHLVLFFLVHLLLMIVTFVHALQLPPLQHQSNQDSLNETQCLACIRLVTSANVDPVKRCEGYYCGPYQFSYQYWAEAGKPAAGPTGQGAREFEKCARDKNCAESTVRAYFKKFKRDCNNDGLIDCLDMAALHKAGPGSCSHDWFHKSRYWQSFNKTTCVIDREPYNPQAADRSRIIALEATQNRQKQQQQVIMKNQTLTSECLDCICEALTSCSGGGVSSSSNCGSGTVCGPFAISQSYWKDGRRPGASWTACARTKECSSLTIKNYMEKFKRDCTGDGYVTCEDYAAIHRRGPKSCVNRDLMKEQYWSRFLACRANQKPMNDANLVKVNEDAAPGVDLASRFDSTMTLGSSISTAAVTTTQQTSTSSTVLTTQQQPTPITTQSPRLSTANADRYEFKLDQAGESGRGTQTTSTSASKSPIAYELAPLNHQDGQQNSYQLGQAHNHQTYEYAESTSNDQDHHPQQPYTRGPSSSSVVAVQTQPMDQDQYGFSPTPNQQQQRPPLDDYNSLPTIILGKPLGSASSNRISVPPPPQHQYQHESYPDGGQTMTTNGLLLPATLTQQPTTSSSTATPRYAASELYVTTAAGGGSPPNIESNSNQQHPADESLMSDNSQDYASSADFGPNGFDRVVNGIVANPEFSKSYPPVPEIVIQQRKQPSGASQRGPTQVSQTQQTTSKVQAGPKETNPTTTTTTGTNNKRENSKTLSPAIYGDNSQHQQESSQHKRKSSSSSSSTTVDDSQPLPPSSVSSIVGSDSLNMTNLFERGLNESSKIPSECLDCICDASSNCDTTVQCISKQREKNRCGLYMISWNQYKESDISLTSLMSFSQQSPNGSSSSSSSASSASAQNDDYDEKLYYECSTDKNCAEKLIHLYIEKYSKDCNHDGKIDCYDIAALHRVGPDQCNSNKFLSSQYWRDFNHCYATDRLTTTVQPQTASSSSSSSQQGD